MDTKAIKTTIILIYISIIKLYAQAPVALHHNGTSTMFATSSGLTDAYNNSVDGDTIYLPGGFFAGITIDKKLTLIGAGFHPDSTLATYATQINGNLNLGPNADTTHIEGLHITGSINITATNNKIDKLKIKRNLIDGQININGDRATPSMHIEISGNIVRGHLDLSNTLNAVITNNILQSRLHYVYQGMIRNNVFTSNPFIGYPIYQYNNIYDCDYSSIENNVFVHADATLGFSYCDNSTINKNVFATNNIDYSNNFPLGNYIGIGSANILVNWTSSSYLFTDNYHLQNPTTHLGTDGLEVGIYGGLKPWKEGIVPLNPHIGSKNIATQTNTNGELPIQIRVNAQND